MSTRPFKVDGVSIPTPTTYKPGLEDLSSDATGRSLDGVMHKDVIATKIYFQCSWSRLSWNDAATLINAISGKTQVQFTYADPRYPNAYRTGAFYVGKIDLGALDLSDPKTSRRNWQDISCQFTEI